MEKEIFFFFLLVLLCVEFKTIYYILNKHTVRHFFAILNAIKTSKVAPAGAVEFQAKSKANTKTNTKTC